MMNDRQTPSGAVTIDSRLNWTCHSFNKLHPEPVPQPVQGTVSMPPIEREVWSFGL
jgi:hypothetical protein